MTYLTWKEAHALKQFYRDMVKDVNDAFTDSTQQIVGLMIVPYDADGRQKIFSQFLNTHNIDLDVKPGDCTECCVIVVIQDKSKEEPFYFFKELENILAG